MCCLHVQQGASEGCVGSLHCSVAPSLATSPEHARRRHYETQQMTPRNRLDEKHDPTGGACHLFMASKAFGHSPLSASVSSPPKFLNYFVTSLQKKQQQFTPLRPLRLIRQISPLGILGEHSTTLEIQRL